jgi:hypothetical protein
MAFGIGSKKTDPEVIESLSQDQEMEPIPFENLGYDKKGGATTGAANEVLNDEQAAKRLRRFRELAENDPNIATEDLDAVDFAVEGHDPTKENNLIHELIDDSPYPEVCYQS